MKRLCSLFCSLVLLCALAPAAYADILWTPQNTFFERHENECTYVGRSYYANGSEGYVTLWDAPDGRTVCAQYENGCQLRVYWQYKDWGCISVWGDEGSVDGWVPMADLVLIYDYLSFEEEYAGQISDYSGQFAHYEGSSDGFTFWEYPGAPQPKLVWDYDDIIPILTGSEGKESYISKVFTDENGLTWGYIGYFFGNRNSWLCLDDPTGTEFPLRSIPKTLITPAATPQLPAPSITPYILVAGVAGITVVLVLLLKGKKTQK